MTTLRGILATHYPQTALTMTTDRAALERDLKRHARLTAIVYSVLFGLQVLILLAVGLLVALDVRDGRGVRTGLLAGAGISFPVILELIRRTVREWSHTDLVALLSRRLDGKSLQAVIEKLLSYDRQPLA